MNRWPRNKAFFWEIAPFFRVLVPFAAGIVCYYLTVTPSVDIGYYILTSVAAFVLLGISVISKTRWLPPAFSFIVINIGLIALGHSVSYYNDIQNNQKWFGWQIKPTSTYIARIASTPDEKDSSWKLSVNIIYSIDSGTILPVTGKAFVYVDKGDGSFTLRRGDTIMLPGNWQTIKDAGNPFEFSYATFCSRNNIYHRQWCMPHEIWLYGKANIAALPLTEMVHDQYMEQLEHYLGKHKAMGLLQAMLLGDEVNLDEDLKLSYANTGIVHIIAISGGNVSIFFMIIAFLLAWIKHKKYEWVKYALAIPVIWFYVLMAGAQPSAIRAATLFSLLAVGIMFQKNSNGINHLLATAFLLLCAEPAWLYSVGFQLSFVAVLSIMLFYKPVYNWIPTSVTKAKGKLFSQTLYRILRTIWGAIAMSIAAEVLVAPLVVYYFHTFPVMFIVANVAAFLFMGIVLVLGMVLVAVSAMPVVAGLIASIIKWLVDVFGNLVHSMQGAGPQSFNYLILSGCETLLLYTTIAGMAWYSLQKNKPALITGLIGACLLLLSFCVNEWNKLYQRRLVVYSSSHSSHIELIEGRNYYVLQTDTAFSKETNYATSPSHIGWGAWRHAAAKQKEIFIIGGKTVLILTHEIEGKEPFPVDYLILCYKGHISIPNLDQTFHPKTVVIGNNYPARRQKALKGTCDSLGINAYMVSEKGAFVLGD